MAGSRDRATLVGALCALLVAVPAAGAAPSTAWAQDSPEANGALEFYRSGREHFSAGRYREAIGDLERARMLDPDSPTLIYNIARVHELLGEIDQALLYYREYIRMLPEGEDTESRIRVLSTIQRLEGARQQVTTPTQPPTTPTMQQETQLDPVIVVEERGVADEIFWGAAVVSGVLLVSGVVVGMSALSAQSDAADTVLGEMRPDGRRVDSVDRMLHANNADDRALIADLLFVGALLSGAAAGLLYVLRTEQIETRPGYERPAFSAVATPRGAVVGVRGSL